MSDTPVAIGMKKGSRAYGEKTRWVSEILFPIGHMSCLTIRVDPLTKFLCPVFKVPYAHAQFNELHQCLHL